jgi:hypothetical protein
MNLTRPIVVVDRRTYRIARRKITALMGLGEYARAKFGLTATQLWLRHEVRTGPGRHRSGTQPTWNSWRPPRPR